MTEPKGQGLAKPSPEEIADILLAKIRSECNVWIGDFVSVQKIIAETLRAERQRTMPSQEEFGDKLISIFSNMIAPKSVTRVRMAAPKLYDWLAQRMK